MNRYPRGDVLRRSRDRTSMHPGYPMIDPARVATGRDQRRYDLERNPAGRPASRRRPAVGLPTICRQSALLCDNSQPVTAKPESLPLTFQYCASP